jgi:hypothetical protein
MKNHLQIVKYTIASSVTNNHNKKLVLPIYQILMAKESKILQLVVKQITSVLQNW